MRAYFLLAWFAFFALVEFPVIKRNFFHEAKVHYRSVFIAHILVLIVFHLAIGASVTYAIECTGDGYRVCCEVGEYYSDLSCEDGTPCETFGYICVSDGSTCERRGTPYCHTGTYFKRCGPTPGGDGCYVEGCGTSATEIESGGICTEAPPTQSYCNFDNNSCDPNGDPNYPCGGDFAADCTQTCYINTYCDEARRCQWNTEVRTVDQGPCPPSDQSACTEGVDSDCAGCTIAPTAPAVSGDSCTSDNTPTWTWSNYVDPDPGYCANYSVSIDRGWVSGAPDGSLAEGTVSYTASSSLSDGPYTFGVRYANDKGDGQWGYATTEIDTSVPEPSGGGPEYTCYPLNNAGLVTWRWTAQNDAGCFDISKTQLDKVGAWGSIGNVDQSWNELVTSFTAGSNRVSGDYVRVNFLENSGLSGQWISMTPVNVDENPPQVQSSSGWVSPTCSPDGDNITWGWGDPVNSGCFSDNILRVEIDKSWDTGALPNATRAPEVRSFTAGETRTNGDYIRVRYVEGADGFESYGDWQVLPSASVDLMVSEVSPTISSKVCDDAGTQQVEGSVTITWDAVSDIGCAGMSSTPYNWDIDTAVEPTTPWTSQRTVTFGNLSTGQHVAYIWTRDTLGNKTYSPIAFTIVACGSPTCAISGLPASATVGSTYTITLTSVNDAENDSVVYRESASLGILANSTFPTDTDIYPYEIGSTIDWTSPSFPSSPNVLVEVSDNGGTTWSTCDGSAIVDVVDTSLDSCAIVPSNFSISSGDERTLISTYSPSDASVSAYSWGVSGIGSLTSTDASSTTYRAPASGGGSAVINLTIIDTSGGSVDCQSSVLVTDASLDFGVTLSPPSDAISVGDSTQFVGEIRDTIGDWTDPVSWTCLVTPTTGAPTCSPSSGSVSQPSSTSDVVLNISNTNNPGTFNVNFQGTSNGVTRSSSSTLAISQQSVDFEVVITPLQQTVDPGDSTSYTVTANSINGFSSLVTLSVQSLENYGISFSWDSDDNTLEYSNGEYNSTQLSAYTSSTTQEGGYAVVVTGTSSGVSHDSQASLNVSGVCITPATPTGLQCAGITQDSVTAEWNPVTAGGTSAYGYWLSYRTCNPNNNDCAYEGIGAADYPLHGWSDRQLIKISGAGSLQTSSYDITNLPVNLPEGTNVMLKISTAGGVGDVSCNSAYSLPAVCALDTPPACELTAVGATYDPLGQNIQVVDGDTQPFTLVVADDYDDTLYYRTSASAGVLDPSTLTFQPISTSEVKTFSWSQGVLTTPPDILGIVVAAFVKDSLDQEGYCSAVIDLIEDTSPPTEDITVNVREVGSLTSCGGNGSAKSGVVVSLDYRGLSGSTDSDGKVVFQGLEYGDYSGAVVSPADYSFCDGFNSFSVSLGAGGADVTKKIYPTPPSPRITINQGNMSVVSGTYQPSLEAGEYVIEQSGSLLANGDVDPGIFGGGGLGPAPGGSNVYLLKKYQDEGLDVLSLIEFYGLSGGNDHIKYVNGDQTIGSATYSPGGGKTVLMVNGDLLIEENVKEINADVVVGGSVTIQGKSLPATDKNLTINGFLMVGGNITNARRAVVSTKSEYKWVDNDAFGDYPSSKIYWNIIN